MSVLPSRINVLAELERLGLKYKYSGDDEVLIPCPFHDDKNPSCSVNTGSGAFKCHAAGCSEGGDFIKLSGKLTGKSRAQTFEELAKYYDLGTDEFVEPEVIERWHSRIWESGVLLQELKKRAITEETIRRHRLGENEGRITIPIKGKSGHWVTVRKYLPGAPGPEKMRNMRGRGSPRLYPVSQLEYETVCVCGGEIKALAASQQLNRLKIGAVSPTCGEGNWEPAFNEEFKGKKVFVIYDVDTAGRDAAQIIAAHLYASAAWVGVCELPLDVKEHPHGDINDFMALGGNLENVLAATKEWHPTLLEKGEDDSKPTCVTFGQAYSAAYTETRVCFEAMTSAMAESTYILPKTVRPLCNKDQDMCSICAVKLTKKEQFVIAKDSSTLLQMIDSSLVAQRPAIMQAIGVPKNCPTVNFECDDYYAAEDVRISPKLEISNRCFDKTMQQAIVLKEGVQLNENYRLVGKQYPHPKTQVATLLVTDFDPVGDALAHYTGGDPKKLNKFQPKEWTVDSVKARLNEIYEDFEANVTRIFQRRRLHLALDLVWHSPLFVRFDGRDVKGWVEGLVIGDSAQGKSDTVAGYLAHYGVGEKVDCKNATVAGLLGGLQKLGGRFFVSWGIIPTNDGRLVVLEELKGAPTEVISKLTDMRSSGVAEIPKIEKKRTKARTRLLANSNPRGNRTMASYNYGIEAIQELIGSLEDVRRFDFAICVTAGEVDAKVINQMSEHRPVVRHKYDAESCQQLVLWAWTREGSQVVLDPDAQILCMQRASMLSEQFCDSIPLVDRASMRYKLARLAAAAACRTYSTDDGKTCRVRTCHVDLVYDFLKASYESPAMGYSDYTKAVKAMSTMVEPDSIVARIKTVPHSKDFGEHILRANKFDFQDLRDWCGCDRVESESLLSFLVRKRAIIRMGRSYVKTSPFIDLLKRLVESGDLPDTPSFLESGEF